MTSTEYNKILHDLHYEKACAVFKESCYREADFLRLNDFIVGIEVVPFTFRHYLLLDFKQSPFLGKQSEINEIKILDFLWLVSTEYVEKNKEKYQAFFDKHKAINYVEAYEGILSYLEEHLLDVDREGSTDKKNQQAPFFAWPAIIIDELAFQYGWTVEYILSLPVAQVFQLSRVIQCRLGLSKSFTNYLTDKVQSKIVQHITNKGKLE